MVDLEIRFQCMCLFVPEPVAADAKAGTVHVLMPTTNGCHDSDCSDGPGVAEHVVRLIHPDLTDPKGVSLAGWKLELGVGHATAEVSLDPHFRPKKKRKA